MCMLRYEASFEIDSKTDSYTVQRIIERVYDTIREEPRSIWEGSDDGSALLDEFEAPRDTARDPAPGKLTVIYEHEDGGFDN